ncbi:MAG TPA: AraC family transcriptional regulator [Burkholderiales bacterium]|nr:AraC family transcriptional regulator [Burkholderiales bacterium]
MPVQRRLRHRHRPPELELEASRMPSLGYEAAEDVGFIRCLDHGFPTPLARWHYHDEYELHLIVATSGKAFVGDWIGQFQPGHLVLTGPRLPHNWISLDVPDGGVRLRDRVIQFHHEPIAKACKSVPELAEVLPLLERARNGIEFFGLSDRARLFFGKIKGSRGLERFAAFCQFMAELSHCTEYQLLSSARLQSSDDDASLDQINSIVNQLTENISQAPSMSEFAAQFGMTESRFSRFFRRATGNNFIDFVNRVRISRACLLLMDSDRYITHICYDVGFNNVANFNRRFLEIKGMTPSEFRRHADRRFGV